MSCICAKATDEWHGWECSITGGACMYLSPNQDQCADDYGEVDHTEAWEKKQEVYANLDKKCECCKCEKQESCLYKDKYQRLPRTSPGALGLCPKLKK